MKLLKNENFGNQDYLRSLISEHINNSNPDQTVNTIKKLIDEISLLLIEDLEKFNINQIIIPNTNCDGLLSALKEKKTPYEIKKYLDKNKSLINKFNGNGSTS